MSDPQVEPSSWRCPCGCGSTTGCFVYSGDDAHVGRPVGPHAPMTGRWVCADDCPHPDHSGSNPHPKAET